MPNEFIGRHNAAKTRVAEYLRQHARMSGLDPTVVHNLNGGDEVEGGITLTVADLRTLIGWVE